MFLTPLFEEKKWVNLHKKKENVNIITFLLILILISIFFSIPHPLIAEAIGAMSAPAGGSGGGTGADPAMSELEERLNNLKRN